MHGPKQAGRPGREGDAESPDPSRPIPGAVAGPQSLPSSHAPVLVAGMRAGMRAGDVEVTGLAALGRIVARRMAGAGTDPTPGKGFYRRFEKRRPDGSLVRGRRG